MNQNDNKHHKKIKTILRVVGITLLVAGIVFLITGLVDFFRAAASFGDPPKLFWCCFVGMPLIFFGASCTVFGFKREIGRYVKNETIPIANEIGKDLQPGISAVAEAFKKANEPQQIQCECGELNDADSKFCKACGKSLIKVCPDCHEPLDADSKFCNHCGRKIE